MPGECARSYHECYKAAEACYVRDANGNGCSRRGVYIPVSGSLPTGRRLVALGPGGYIQGDE